MTKLEKLKAAYDAACDASYAAAWGADAYVAARDADAYVAARDAYDDELKKIQEENSND
jgi:hypothetical protein